MTMSPGEPTQRYPRATLPDRYRDPVPIGMGGMGEVYRARDVELGRDVAVKVLAERLAGQQEFRRRFRREAVSAARIAHPNVATVYDVGDHAGRPYLVMEYLSGGALADRIAGRPPPEQAIDWIEQTAGALDAAHERGVIHRDIKPANLLLDRSGNVKVADFGIARVLEGGGSTVTAAGTVLGTAGYLAPEQARAEPATRATDIYSLAVVAFELLTGERPFGGRSVAAEMAAHLYEPVPAASGREPALPPEVDAVLERGMAKEPGRRHPSAGALAAELRAAALPAFAPTAVTAVAPPPPPRAEAPQAPPPPEPQPDRIVARARRRRALAPVLIPLAVLLAAAGVGAALLAGGDGDPKRPTAGAPASTTVERTVSTAAVAERPDPPDPLATAHRDVDRSTALLSEGDPTAALPLAVGAFEALRGTDDPYEGNAGYNAGRSLIDLGRCDEAVPYLEASAGTGSESQNAIRQAALEEARSCAGGGDEGGDEDGDEGGDGGEAPASVDEAGDGGEAPASVDEAIALTDESTAAMRSGDATQALALAAQALDTLAGTGHAYEGNASYNAGRSLIDLGRCGEAVPLLQRSLDVGTGTKDERKIRRETLKEAGRCD